MRREVKLKLHIQTSRCFASLPILIVLIRLFHNIENSFILNPLIGISPIFVALIGFLLKLSHPLRQSNSSCQDSVDRGQDRKILPAPGTNQIAAFAGYSALTLREKKYEGNLHCRAKQPRTATATYRS